MAVTRKPVKPEPIKTAPAAPKTILPKAAATKPLDMPPAEAGLAMAKAATQTLAAVIPPAVPVAAMPLQAMPPAASDALAQPVANLQEMLRLAAETSVERSKLAYERLRSSAEDTTETIESAFKVAADGSTAINNKAIDLLRSNANAFFDLAKSLTEVKSLSEVIVLQTEFARKQFETFSAQSKELSGLVQKVAADTAAPLNAAAARSFGTAA